MPASQRQKEVDVAPSPQQENTAMLRRRRRRRVVLDWRESDEDLQNDGRTNTPSNEELTNDRVAETQAFSQLLSMESLPIDSQVEARDQDDEDERPLAQSSPKRKKQNEKKDKTKKKGKKMRKFTSRGCQTWHKWRNLPPLSQHEHQSNALGVSISKKQDVEPEISPLDDEGMIELSIGGQGRNGLLESTSNFDWSESQKGE
uniref:Uncharacterized protein n=1 Tax=Palpitomonas bilix TaxID=652834 RepID=A0A7S3LU50_9EUKA|mmetsp:Transcript_46845/g.120700  ORF Transcript_46845/g.120700 Transcript_46845/m.120700 type:complete len:202 (+) Transcript_46845:890-1495(+)